MIYNIDSFLILNIFKNILNSKYFCFPGHIWPNPATTDHRLRSNFVKLMLIGIHETCSYNPQNKPTFPMKSCQMLVRHTMMRVP